MKNADPLVTLNTQLPQHAVQFGNFKAFFVMNQTVITLRHDKRNEFCKSGKRTKKTTLFTVAEAAACGVAWHDKTS